MTVVRNELERGENSPSRILSQRVMSAAYLWHNYGHSTIGNRADLEHVPIARLQAFYRRYYRPDNALLVVAGTVGRGARARRGAARLRRPPGARRAPPRHLHRGASPGRRAARHLAARGGRSALQATYHVPEGSHPDFAALDVLTHVFANAPSGRLYKALVEPKKASSASAYNFQLHDPGVLDFMAEVREGQPLEAARDTLVKTVEESARAPFTQDEVDRARTSLLKAVDLMLNDSERAAIQLSEWAAIGDWRLLFLHRDRIDAVTPADVTRVAGQYLKSLQPHPGPVPPHPRAGPGRHAASRGRGRHAPGLQGPGRGGPGRGVRPFPGEHRAAGAARAGGEREAGAPAQEDARADGPGGAQPALGYREGARGQERRGGRRWGHAPARHPAALAPGAARRLRQAQGPRGRERRRHRGQRLGGGPRAEPPRGDEAGGRGAARARLRCAGVRALAAGAARRARGPAQRAHPEGPHRLLSRPLALPRGPPLPRGQPRGVARGGEGHPARGGACLPPGVLRRLPRGARRRGGLRRRGARAAGGGVVGRVEEPSALRARGGAALQGGGGVAGARDAGQGQCPVHGGPGAGAAR